ncbi:glycosyltransferase family 2 protein [bacterium]|nr:glycosyltransferase family 2 protein [bacterium]
MEFLPRCLESLRKTTYSPIEIVVADNLSTDGSLAYLRESWPDVQIIELGENRGYSGAYNRTVPQASGEYCVLLNFDVEVEPNWLEQAIEMLESLPQVAAVQPKLKAYQHHDRFEYSGGSGGFLDAYGFPYVRGRIFDSIETDKGQYDDPVEVFWATGAALVVRKESFIKAGGLDEDFFMHMEELDFCWRLWLTGQRVMVAPRGTVYHWAGAALSADRFRKMYLNHRNSLAMLFKNYELRNLAFRLPVRWFLDWTAILSSPLRGEPKRSAAILAAHLHFLWNVPRLIIKRRRVQAMRTVSDRELEHVIAPLSLVWRYFVKKQKTFSQLHPIS